MNEGDLQKLLNFPIHAQRFRNIFRRRARIY